MTSRHANSTHAQWWLACALGRRDVFKGDTTTEVRRERFRKVIVERNLGNEYAGNFGTRRHTYGEVFEKLFQQPLHVEQPEEANG